MNLLTKLFKYWKTILVSLEIVLLFYFGFHIVEDGGISGTNFVLTITFLLAILNTLFLIIFLNYDEGTYRILAKIGQLLSILNFAYTSLVFSDVLSVSSHWIPAMITSLIIAGLALQFYIGLGSLHRLRHAWLFRINSFLIILVTFYGVFLLLLKTEKGAYFDLFYYGIVVISLMSMISNLINLKSDKKLAQEA